MDDIDHPRHQDNTHSRAEHPSDYCPQLEDIPELETDEENWEEGQFEDADLTDRHNTTEESDRIRCEYSAHFEKVTEQEYSPYHSTTSGFEYQIPEPEYYNSDTRPKQHQRYQNPNIYLPPHHLRKIYIHGMVTIMEEPSAWSCIAIGCTGRKPDH